MLFFVQKNAAFEAKNAVFQVKQEVLLVKQESFQVKNDVFTVKIPFCMSDLLFQHPKLLNLPRNCRFQ